MPNDSLASIRSELQERLDATQEEVARLRAALDALNDGSSSATSRPAADGRNSAIAAAATLAHAGAVTTRRGPQRARSSTTSTGRAKRGAPRKGRGPAAARTARREQSDRPRRRSADARLDGG